MLAMSSSFPGEPRFVVRSSIALVILRYRHYSIDRIYKDISIFFGNNYILISLYFALYFSMLGE